MIVNERIRDYLRSLDSGNGELCDAIAKDAVASYIPIIKKETESLLKTMVAAKRPRTILAVSYTHLDVYKRQLLCAAI